MNMLSQPIELDKVKFKENQRQENKRPATYSKGQKKAPISEEVHEGSLEVIKQLIANNQSPALGAVSKIEASSQVGALYEKMLQSIVMVHAKGDQETTFFLDGDAFNTSVFHGAKITITEYSTAPKVFNIEFSSHSKAVALFESHAAELMIALQKQDLGFSVYRIDTSLMAEDERYALKKVEREDEA